MEKIKLVVFDLAGTTVQDDAAVSGCLYKAAIEYGLECTHEEILKSIGTNKIHLFQYLIAKKRGAQISFKGFEGEKDPSTYDEAMTLFQRYTEIMIEYYRTELKPVPGAEDTFAWCHDKGIYVATDTGFHRDVTSAIMEGLGWLDRKLVDIAVCVEDVPNNIGRPAPFMIFHAMRELDVQSVKSVIKIGDMPADMLEGYNAGCAGIIGVGSGPLPNEEWGKYYHTHFLPSVKELPKLIEREFSI